MPKVIVFGATPDAESIGMTLSLAEVTGGLARERTVVADLSLEAKKLHQLLRTPYDDATLEQLADEYFRTGRITVASLDVSIGGYPVLTRIGNMWKHFDFLVAPTNPSPQLLDRLTAHRGGQFYHHLIQCIAQLDYEWVLVNVGHSLATVRCQALGTLADALMVIGHDGDTYRSITAKYIQPLLAEHYRNIYTIAMLPKTFPNDDFPDIVESADAADFGSAPKWAVQCAEFYKPGISVRLAGSVGQRIQPRFDASWQSRARQFFSDLVGGSGS